MSQRTAFLAKLIGLYCVLYALSMFAHRQATVETIAALINSPATLLVLGVVILGAGLAMVLAHNLWSGGVLPVVVTIVGWLTLLKGLLLVLLPPAGAAAYLSATHFEQLSYLYGAVTLLLGAYLTYGGFSAKPKP
jgi:hypothetical protein